MGMKCSKHRRTLFCAAVNLQPGRFGGSENLKRMGSCFDMQNRIGMGLHHLFHGIYFIIPFDKVNIQPLKLQKKDIRKRKSSADFID